MNYPLDYLHPEIFGEMDEQEQYLICEFGALDLVLLENASEVVRRTLQSQGVLEIILEKMCYENGNTKYIYVETFPFYFTSSMGKKYFNKLTSTIGSEREFNVFQWPPEYKKEEFFHLVNSHRNEIAKLGNRPIVTILGLDLEEYGGHYVALYYENGIVSLFDSMQTSQNNKNTGTYTPFFINLAQELFPTSKITVPDCVMKELSVQFTGGFSGFNPLEVELSNLSDEDKEIIAIQSPESQNHFCYMWAIWWIHLKLLKINMQNVLPIFKHLDPLVVIKRYIYGVLKNVELSSIIGSQSELNISVEKDYVNFYNKHFLNIWTNVPPNSKSIIGSKNKLIPNFERYEISEPENWSTMGNVLGESLKIPLFKKVSKTKIPKNLCPKNI